MAIDDVWFGLDRAKLAPPPVRPASVDKSGVVARLIDARVPFATVIAPAGYGKTTLLSRWTKADRRQRAWVSLDERDDDSVVFLRDIAAARNRIFPLPAAVFDALSGPADSIYTRVAAVGNALAAIDKPIVMILDDLHEVSNPSCLTALAALFDYVPPDSLIVIASREQPALPLARWRALGMLVEAGASDLRLDQREANLLLRGANVELDATNFAVLTERTEGWPVGLYLAALSLQRGSATISPVEGFAGNDRYVSEYFRLEVLSRLPEAEARFLMETSVLDKMNGPLCDAALATSGSADMLGVLERSNQFVVPLDERAEWFRYHHLFRQLLLDELNRTSASAVRDLNRRAMEWCISNRDLETAVRYGHAAGEMTSVAELVDRISLPVYYDGRLETLDEWIGWFTDEQLTHYPALAVVGAWLRAMTGRVAQAEQFMALAQRSESIIPLSDGSDSIQPWIATLRAFMMPNGAQAAYADADQAVAQLAAGSAWRPSALIMRGIAEMLLGSPNDARADLEAALVRAQTLGGTDEVFIPQSELALISASHGDWEKAAELAEAARTLCLESNLDGYVVSAIVHAAVARIAIHERRYADARAALTRAHRLRPLMGVGIPWLAVQVSIELARAHLALGEGEAARAVLADGSAVLRQRPDLGTLGDEVQELEVRAASAGGQDGGWAVNSTAAELRLLPYLATHLTFSEIGARLFITNNTVTSEAKSIYRKLDASSRGNAIERAVQVGLLEPVFPHRSGVGN